MNQPGKVRITVSWRPTLLASVGVPALIALAACSKNGRNVDREPVNVVRGTTATLMTYVAPVDGVRSGRQLRCDDGNPCTTDSCDAFGCVHTNNTLPCSDGDPCTTDDVCAAGVCSGGFFELCNVPGPKQHDPDGPCAVCPAG